jgi:hypothetical protein
LHASPFPGKAGGRIRAPAALKYPLDEEDKPAGSACQGPARVRIDFPDRIKGRSDAMIFGGKKFLFFFRVQPLRLC